MPLAETILTIWSASAKTVSGGKVLRDFLKDKVGIEDVLTKLIEEKFQQHLPRLQHLCLGGEITFDAKQFCEALSTKDINVQRTDDLQEELIPILANAVIAPAPLHEQEDFLPVYKSILNAATRAMWKRIGMHASIANETMLKQNESILSLQNDTRQEIQDGFSEAQSTLSEMDTKLSDLAEDFDSLAKFALSIFQQVYDKLLDVAPPPEHKIDQDSYPNPFLLARAEDFNHNYEKLAKLFQDSPDWDSIQSRTDNVFIEGGRGTGKSMLLRRLTAQATVAAKRLQEPNVTFENMAEDYFGVYVKFTRGYYEQLEPKDNINPKIASLLAQHELNIEIFDAYVDTLRWLLKERALPSLSENVDSIVQDLALLFDCASQARTLEELQKSIVRFEQDQIIKYYRGKAFDNNVQYSGSAQDTVKFIRQLSEIFRNRLFPRREIRLFLLIDEFESLLEIQQVALNTVMKMRLPDLSLKIAVRKSGRKTANTFTDEDPIQQPRDYKEVRLDHYIKPSSYKSSSYSKLLEGIAAKRLADAGYPDTSIKSYLVEQNLSDEISSEELEAELNAIWSSGQRRNEEMNSEFRTKYTLTATYRILRQKNRRKSFSGFEQYVNLSSGIVSNFIELCKYAFYFALSDQLPLRHDPSIPFYTQTEAAYSVSQRSLETIDGNVPMVGSTLAVLLSDIGSILRSRLFHHPSEPEANRLAIVDFSNLSQEENKLIAQVIDGAIVWSVFHIEAAGEAFRPKNSARPPSAELIINRIYCPALGISYRARWRVELKVGDMKNLIDPLLRNTQYRGLMRTIGTSPSSADEQPSLFS